MLTIKKKNLRNQSFKNSPVTHLCLSSVVYLEVLLYLMKNGLILLYIFVLVISKKQPVTCSLLNIIIHNKL